MSSARKKTGRFRAGFVFALSPVFLATACPIYDAGSEQPCEAGYAYDAALGVCQPLTTRPDPDVPLRCRSSSDCPDGQSCDAYHRCQPDTGEPSGEGGAAGSGSPGAGGAGGDAT